MKKILFFGIPAATIIGLNIAYGSVLSWFLSITIIACLLFYVTKLGLENIINTKLQQYQQGDPRIGKMVSFNNKWKSILNFGLLTVVFLSGVFAVYFTMNPQSDRAWFSNNEYHGLSNTGIAFNKSLNVYPILQDSASQNAKITFAASGNNQANITFSQFYQPVIQVNEEGEGRLLNNIFAQNITDHFTIKNAQNSIQVQVKETQYNFFQKLFGAPDGETEYIITLQSNDRELLDQYNLVAPYTDKITIKDNPLQKGMALFDLFLDAKNIQSGKAESYQVLESILLELGNTYLLADYDNKQKALKIFPDNSFFDNGYQLWVNGQAVVAKTTNTTSIPLNEQFYIGFNNSKKRLHIGSINNTDYAIDAQHNMALLFDYPNTYMLKSPGVQSRGDKNIRFITNDFDRIIADNLKEGFYFTTYNLKVTQSIDGNVDYITGGANTPLAIAVTDNNNKGKHHKIENQKFSLRSEDNSVQYLFDLRDFSKNGFSPDNTVLYLGIIYIAFVVLSVFFSGKKIDRLEPIILSVIFVLTALRFILYWRVATFPPLDNITKYELENTLINFDFNMGTMLPVPLTLVWVLLFVLVIIIYRSILNKKGDFSIAQYLKLNTGNVAKINKSYILFIAACLVLFYINKKIIHIEIFTRIISILVPLLGYWYFSKISNQYFEYKPLDIQGEKSKLKIQFKAYFYYLFNNPTFLITASTILFFAICDRGFAILFTLFILLKNIFVNFLKKPLDRSNNSVKRMLYKPNNYWIYGFTALVVYLTTLSFKSLFYYLLTYKLLVILVVLILAVLIVYVLYPRNSKLLKISTGVLALWAILIAIPFTRTRVDHQLNDVVKHVQYRASIIHQPISELLQENEYTSFKTRKIIETAENQWFINSYISKPYDKSHTINLRPHSRVGVDYPTQTRDVVIARYVISELGDFMMYLILILILLPMILYLISYKVHMVPTSQSTQKDLASYAGLIPLILLFTIALFVWLTATNRFVFFGQDFPFLSLTSRVSVILPLLLLGLTLVQTPTLQHSFNIKLQNNAIKYLFFVGLIAAFALTTVKKNELNNKNFSITLDKTQKHIDVDLNGLLSTIQDSLDNKRIKTNYAQLISILGKDERFTHLKNDVVTDPYTRSILNNLIDKPSTAFELNNPLFIIFDNERYNAVYNKNMYLELPPIESRKIWNGNVSESLFFNDVSTALVTYNNQAKNVNLPYFINDPSSSIQFALMPGNWFAHTNQENVGIINVNNSSKGQSHIFVYKNVEKNIEQNATSFVSTLNNEDLATVFNKDQSFTLGFRNAGNRYALNKWINGEYKIVYPLKENNFWIYNFANALKTAYSNELELNKDVRITMDYELSKNVQQTINSAGKGIADKNKKYNFSVIAADGDGNVRLMADYVTNRKVLDPNNDAAIYALQRQQFFYSNAKNERDQWGNRNLLNLFLGPGSSIKPLTTSLIASQVNAGWERLIMHPAGVPELDNYAGLKLVKPWKNDDHYYGDVGLAKFLEFSSNYYQSVMMFLGSYSRDYYLKEGKYSLANVLSTNAGANNSFPKLSFNGVNYNLPNFNARKGNWPATDKGKTNKTYFGNENSLIAIGMEQNANLRTKDKEKNDQQLTSIDRVNYVDSGLYNVLDKNRSGGYLWSFPEQSYYLQSERAFEEIQQNFNLGLKTATLGGYPYRLTPFMMLQMYLSMFSQNRNFHLGITKQQLPKWDWQVDSTWKGDGNFRTFMAYNIFQGMSDVIGGANGTGKRLAAIKAQYSNYHFYAKTGTINEQTSKGKSSRRLVVVVSDKDITAAANIGNAKLYAWYFAVDNTGDFDWNVVNGIITQCMESQSFKYYFK
ncbi:hypothetical protein DBR32_06235 [Taibaiella sp. KBW10]|uniref:hypothetical protein n=1 Tax=Taibaiella sp. KBW10 TaxID=2153357 RepID=UPI000F5B3445|nr:hypothetical protein [Taibaiella sp. KBW10]RQO31553.1 hypothetical protein DBR32_06235 [Taibaiella sp. KBW10]